MQEPTEQIYHDLKIDYRLDGSGWAACDVSAGLGRGVSSISITASYLSDALGQLAAAALMLRMGAPSARVSFDEEPGEYRWGFDWHRSPSGAVTTIRVRIWWFDEMWSHRPDNEGQVEFDLLIDQAQFYRAVSGMLDDVLARYGEAGYKSQWDRYSFPKHVQTALNELLDEWPGR